ALRALRVQLRAVLGHAVAVDAAVVLLAGGRAHVARGEATAHRALGPNRLVAVEAISELAGGRVLAVHRRALNGVVGAGARVAMPDPLLAVVRWALAVGVAAARGRRDAGGCALLESAVAGEGAGRRHARGHAVGGVGAGQRAAPAVQLVVGE